MIPGFSHVRAWWRERRRTRAALLRARSPDSPAGRRLSPGERIDIRDALIDDTLDPGGVGPLPEE